MENCVEKTHASEFSFSFHDCVSMDCLSFQCAKFKAAAKRSKIREGEREGGTEIERDIYNVCVCLKI